MTTTPGTRVAAVFIRDRFNSPDRSHTDVAALEECIETHTCAAEMVEMLKRVMLDEARPQEILTLIKKATRR